MARAQVFDFDGVGGTRRFLVPDFDFDEMRSPHLCSRREATNDSQVAQGELAHDAADDNEREQHSEDEVEEIVGGIDGGEADAKGDANEEFSFAGKFQVARWAQAPKHVSRQVGYERDWPAPELHSASMGSERDGNSGDDIVNDGFRFFTRGKKSIGVGRKPYAVR